MAVSVIVSNFNGEKYLGRLLETLKAQVGVELEIIVVDRNSTDGSPRILAAHPEVVVLQEPPETGLVTGYHRGVAKARHDNLFFCNEDMWFPSNCVQLLEAQIKADSSVAAVMPIQRSYDGTRSVNAGIWFIPKGWSPGTPYPFCRTGVKALIQSEDVSGINAGACLITRRAYDQVGGWDTSFFLDYEDGDLSIRLWQHGWRCRLEPSAIVYHAVGASNANRIERGRSIAAKKRYIWSASNKLAVIFKSFTGPSVYFLPILLWCDQFARDLIRLRGENLRLDLASAWVTIQRLPGLFAYRRKYRSVNLRRPGQEYFKDPVFALKSSLD